MKIVISLGISVCVMCVAFFVNAGNECPTGACGKDANKPKGGVHGAGMQIPVMKMADELGLTDEQKTKIAEIENKHSESMKALSEKMRELMKSGQDKKDEINAVKTEMDELRKSIKNEVDSVLTDEQKQKLEQKRAQMRNKLQIKERKNKPAEKKQESAE